MITDEKIETAKKRKYDEFGVECSREIRPGVVEKYDFKKFFSKLINR